MVMVCVVYDLWCVFENGLYVDFGIGEVGMMLRLGLWVFCGLNDLEEQFGVYFKVFGGYFVFG